MDGAADPADQLALPVDRPEHDDVHLVLGADVRIVGQEHVVDADARIVLVLVHDIFRQGLHRDRVHEHVRREHQRVADCIHQRRVHIVHLAGDQRARDAFEGVPGFLVDAPQPVADDLEGDRVDAGRHRSISRPDGQTSVW